MKTLIVADVHLDAAAAGAEEIAAFRDFLRTVSPSEFGRVVLLGDLFDFWYEYRHVIFSAYFPVLRALDELREAGIEMHLVCGNHDFWAGRFLESIGVQVHPDALRLEDNGQRCLLIHGDGLNRHDWVYRMYKRFARWWWVVAGFRLLHPDWAMWVARRVSRTSRTVSEGHPKQGREAEEIRAYACGVIENGEADMVISGHIHEPDHAEWKGGEYFNTGAWLQDRYYLVWDESGVDRRQWEAREKVS